MSLNPEAWKVSFGFVALVYFICAIINYFHPINGFWTSFLIAGGGCSWIVTSLREHYSEKTPGNG